ncbi:MAG: hypothetical protein JW731_06520 [Bacteroidales bacterium]|nr:hypothetical protein [Bacteroidales bacterium]
MNFYLKIFFSINIILFTILAPVLPQQDNESKYNETIKNADEYFKAKDYINAKASYQYASQLNPEATYPREKLSETIKLLREKMVVMEQYNFELAEADKYFRAEEYELAITKYKDALKILPNESYPTEQIKKIENQVAEASDKQSNYDEAIRKAQQFEKYRKFENAKEEYVKAKEIFPDESLPAEKIAEMDVLIAEAAKVKEAYDETVRNADRLFNLKYYENAREEYQKAADAKPDEDYPPQKIKEIDHLLVQKNEFDLLVNQGDEFYMAKNLEEAKAKYQAALRIYPAESYPRDMIDRINNSLKSLRDNDELYEKALSDADNFVEQRDYTNAIKEYQNASGIKPDENLPKQKIEEIKSLIAQQEAGELEYNQSVQNGEQLLAKKDYVNAKTEFEKAVSIRPDEAYPQKKLNEINLVLKEREAVQGRFDETVTKADVFFEGKDYDQAEKEYQKALVIIPGAPVAVNKLDEIKKIKAGLLEKEIEYGKVIAEADKLFDKNDLVSARTKYTEARQIDDTKAYPNEKIDEINGLLAQKQELENEFNRAVAAGDIFFNKQELESALTEYQKANSLKPSEKYPIDQIGLISKKIAEGKSLEENYNSLIASADRFYQEKDFTKAKKDYEKALDLKPAEAYPNDQIKLINTLLTEKQQAEQRYIQLMADADRYFKDKNYAEAIAKYGEAFEINPESAGPSEKIKEIDGILAGLALQQEQYNAAITEADRLFDEGKYDEAKAKYESAAKINPSDVHSNKRIGEIEILIATKKSNDENYITAIAAGEKFLSGQSYAEAKSEFEKAASIKPGEPYPSQKIIEINNILTGLQQQQNAYDQVIANADRLFSEAKYDIAKTEYQKAQEMKPGEKYPADRIKEIEGILQNLDFTKKQYAETLAAADQLFSQGKYDKAILEYQIASDVYPTEQYPKDKIVEIKNLLAKQSATDEQYNLAVKDAESHYRQKFYDQALARYQDAADLKPDEKLPKDKIAEITLLLASINKEQVDYSTAIKEGDNHFALKEYDEAKLSYMKASNIRPQEVYPKNKIAEIEQLLTDQATTMALYNRAVAAADRMMETKEYDKAKAKYTEASTLMPNEQYPNDQMKKIDDIYLQMELQTQQAYNDAITEADRLFGKEEYEQAKIKYQGALKIKPEELYPVQKIAEIERLVSDFEELKTRYNEMIAEADRHFKAREYDNAKARYVEASALFPEEEYPINKIEEINLIFRAENQRIQQAYDKAIADADKFFSASAFDQALDSYRNARSIKPDETYPDEMISKIMVIMDKNAVRDLVKSAINISDREVKKLAFEPVSVSDRKSNFIVIRARNTSGNEFKVVMSYGKGGSKNGGFVLPIPADESSKEYIIPVGKQYTWFSEDNDYISLVPEGGTIEVSTLKISRSN